MDTAKFGHDVYDMKIEKLAKSNEYIFLILDIDFG